MTPLPGAASRFPSGCSKWRAGGLHLGRNKPDIIIVFLGYNDWGNAVPVYQWKRENGIIASLRHLLTRKKEMKKRLAMPLTFYEAYEDTIRQICQYYPKAEVWCCTLGDTCMKDNPQWSFPKAYAGIPAAQYNDAIRTVARQYGAGVIDFSASGRLFQTMDGSHPTEQGMRELAMETFLALTGRKETKSFSRPEMEIGNAEGGGNETVVLADYNNLDEE